MSLDDDLRRRIDEMVSTKPVVLFMKGTRRAPACGFSAAVVGILDELIQSYETVDVLGSPELREGIKVYSEWPTLPQLYVRGRFLGGADIVRELAASGELAKELGVTEGPPALPRVHLTAAAAEALRQAASAEGDPLHFEIDERFSYALFFGPPEAGEVAVEAQGVTLWMNRATMRRADGASIDLVSGPEGAGFKIESPLEPPRVKQIAATELATMIARGEALELCDVRTEAEHAIARIPGARLLDAEALSRLEALDRDVTLVFSCHHGIRSQAAAEHFVGLGFKRVFNLRGGIDAWSLTVDSSVPRY